MGKYSVNIDGCLWNIIIPRKGHYGQLYVRLERYEGKILTKRLCIINNRSSWNGAWTVIVEGQNLLGPRMVDGFKTQMQAIMYAIQIRPDINVETKKIGMRGA